MAPSKSKGGKPTGDVPMEQVTARPSDQQSQPQDTNSSSDAGTLDKSGSIVTVEVQASNDSLSGPAKDQKKNKKSAGGETPAQKKKRELNEAKEASRARIRADAEEMASNKAALKKKAKDEKAAHKAKEKEEHSKLSKQRKDWLNFCWFMSWFIPDACLSCCGMRDPEKRLAWREKFVLFELVLCASAVMLFWLEGINLILCPTRESTYFPDDVSNADGTTGFAIINGYIYDLRAGKQSGDSAVDAMVESLRLNYSNNDLSGIFPQYVRLITDSQEMDSATFKKTYSCISNTTLALQWANSMVSFYGLSAPSSNSSSSTVSASPSPSPSPSASSSSSNTDSTTSDPSNPSRRRRSDSSANSNCPLGSTCYTNCPYPRKFPANLQTYDEVVLPGATTAEKKLLKVNGPCYPNSVFLSAFENSSPTRRVAKLVITKAEIASSDNEMVYNSPFMTNATTLRDKTGLFLQGTHVYDMSKYFAVHKLSANITSSEAQYENTIPYPFLISGINQLGASIASGQTISLSSVFTSDVLSCMDRLFLFSFIDDEDATLSCTITNIILWVISGTIYFVILLKFLLSIRYASSRQPDYQNSYVLLCVPCYTEGTGSLKKTIDSLCVSDYDDHRKLLVVLCDGNITGAGNNKPTPQLVLDILNYEGPEPEPREYIALGEGTKTKNMAKVYVGHYDWAAHLVPYIVIVKVGKPSEGRDPKPGNRGKRDSQLIVLNFINKMIVPFEDPGKTIFTPLEYDLYWKINEELQVNPRVYEYALMVDADTEVRADALNRMVAKMKGDQNIIALCGETKVANEKQSLITMIQVYEYYISHHIGKAFESVFGAVTCLPGCFSLYRMKGLARGTHLATDPVSYVASKNIIVEYSNNKVDTLHLKNLLHLGEDRYLTTLMLKYFPEMRLEFVPSAVCYTIIPDTFAVLLSQRRRWINSTVHNLFELLMIDNLCGCCLFSMRFVVLLDLISTMILPIGTLYLYYIIVMIALEGADRYLVVLIGFAALYGMQIFIFLLRMEFQYLGWLVIYLIAALPVFNIILPVYAFWHFDDFSWGQTRRIEGSGPGGKPSAEEERQREEWARLDKEPVPCRSLLEWETQTLPNYGGNAEDVSEERVGSLDIADAPFASTDDLKRGSIVRPGTARSIVAADAVVVDISRPGRFQNPDARPVSIMPGETNEVRPRTADNRPRTPQYALNSQVAVISHTPSRGELLDEVTRIVTTSDPDAVSVASVRAEIERIFGTTDIDMIYLRECVETLVRQQRERLSLMNPALTSPRPVSRQSTRPMSAASSARPIRAPPSRGRYEDDYDDDVDDNRNRQRFYNDGRRAPPSRSGRGRDDDYDDRDRYGDRDRDRDYRRSGRDRDYGRRDRDRDRYSDEYDSESDDDYRRRRDNERRDRRDRERDRGRDRDRDYYDDDGFYPSDPWNGGSRPGSRGGSRPMSSSGNRPMSSSGTRPMSSSGTRPMSSSGNRPMSSSGRPAPGGRGAPLYHDPDSVAAPTSVVPVPFNRERRGSRGSLYMEPDGRPLSGSRDASPVMARKSMTVNPRGSNSIEALNAGERSTYPPRGGEPSSSRASTPMSPVVNSREVILESVKDFMSRADLSVTTKRMIREALLPNFPGQAELINACIIEALDALHV